MVFLKYVSGNAVESSLTASVYDSMEQILFIFLDFDIPPWFSDSVLDVYELHADLGSVFFVKVVIEKSRLLRKSIKMLLFNAKMFQRNFMA